jgi:hypothetical protein
MLLSQCRPKNIVIKNIAITSIVVVSYSVRDSILPTSISQEGPAGT